MASLKIFTLFIMCAALQEGFGLPLSDQPETETHAPSKRHVRTKRCSCNNWEDKECIYFCHLDIIWINTPSKLLPYGLGSPSSRRRRSVDRCECLNSADAACHGFCRKSSDDEKNGILSQFSKSPKEESRRMLETLRDVVKSNIAIGKKALRLRRRTPLELGKEKE
ncbi:endothelin-2-like [Gouania willdenowi]|uniref:Endothelin-2-like n=1 Tax=Gouania willdenowi TaxID=441366 RepID=A0A8C5ETP2_GOUWI|nr:endothelin-2-like [Gouania willdenowi]